MSRANAWLTGTLSAFAFAACLTNHAALEKKPPSPGTGGAGGRAGTGGSGPSGGDGSGVSGSGGHADYEPPGDSALTIVNGVEDAPSMLICFAKVESGTEAALFGKPVSSTPLAFGGVLALARVPGANAATDSLEPVLIAGDLNLVKGMDCEHAVRVARAAEAPLVQPGAGGTSGAAGAGGEGGAIGSGAAGAAGALGNAAQPVLRARFLPVIPAGTLNAGQSYLLAFDGCMGGSGYTGKDAEKYCGKGYTPDTPTISSLFVPLSRKSSPDNVGMQVVHASRATGAVDVYSRSSLPGAGLGITVASGLVPGQLAPRPALVLHSALEYRGAPDNEVEVWANSVALFGQQWSAILAHADLADLVDGTTYALVLVGPRADLGSGAADFWNPPTFTIVSTSPAF